MYQVITHMGVLMLKIVRLICILGLLVGSASSLAQDETEEAAGTEAESAAPAKTIYIPMKPAFVVNYGGTGKLKYIKADVSIRLSTTAAADAVRHHMPFLRNNLVMLFSAQTDESITSQEGKETLRQEALKTVREVLYNEDRVDGVTDLYFNNFIVQK